MAFPYNTKTHIEFLKRIAQGHDLLKHGVALKEGSERVDSFFEVYLSSDPFEGFDLKTFAEKHTRTMKYPCMVAIGPTAKYPGELDNRKKHMHSSFIILSQIPNDKKYGEQRLSVLELTEQIGEQVIGWIDQYFNINDNDGLLVADQMDSEPIGPVKLGSTTLYGTKFDLVYQVHGWVAYYEKKAFSIYPSEEPREDPCLYYAVMTTEDGIYIVTEDGIKIKIED